MSRLAAQLARLYPAASGRVMVLHVRGKEAGDAVVRLYQAQSEDLGLPLPAISVAAGWGIGLWFSFAAALAPEVLAAFAAGLRQRYLAELPETQIIVSPPSAGPDVPAEDAQGGRWSAFIDPTLLGMFVDEPWLEMAPNPDKQADLLAGLESIPAADLQRVVALLQAPAVAPATERSGSDPYQFLWAVMNDERVDLAVRVQAAAALLPYAKGASI